VHAARWQAAQPAPATELPSLPRAEEGLQNLTTLITSLRAALPPKPAGFFGKLFGR
jgi:hypothetical protein